MKNPIKEILVLNGDPHNGAYQPLKLITFHPDGDQEFLYKSVDPTPTNLVFRLASMLSESLGIANFVDGPVAFTETSYIRMFTGASKPKSTQAIHQYFYGYGVICSVASFLELTDLHFENIIATEAGPKIIDVEFLLSNTQYQSSKWSYKESGLFEHQTSPIGQTESHYHIVAGYGISQNHVIYNHLQPVKDSSHILHGVDGNSLDVLNYAHIIRDGAQDADVLLKAKADKIFSLLNDGLIVNHRIRCWIRGTSYYKILQLQLWLPNIDFNLQKNATREKLLRRNTMNGNISSNTKKGIVEAELHDLIGGDIPYFWLDGSNGDLMHSTGLIQRKFGMSTMDALRRRSNIWNARSFSREMIPIIKRMKAGQK